VRQQGMWRGAHVAAAAFVAGITVLVLLPSDQPVDEQAAWTALTPPPAESLVLDASSGNCCLADDGSGYYSASCVG
jgi:hypothetical protein